MQLMFMLFVLVQALMQSSYVSALNYAEEYSLTFPLSLEHSVNKWLADGAASFRDDRVSMSNSQFESHGVLFNIVPIRGESWEVDINVAIQGGDAPKGNNDPNLLLFHFSKLAPHRKDFENIRRVNIQGISFMLLSNLDARRSGEKELVFMKKESRNIRDSLRFFSKPRNLEITAKCIMRFKNKEPSVEYKISYEKASDNLVFAYLDRVTKQRIPCITVQDATALIGEETYLTIHAITGKKTANTMDIFEIKLFTSEKTKEMEEENLIPNEENDPELPNWNNLGDSQPNVSSLVIKATSHLQENLETMMDVLTVNSREMFEFIKMMNDFMMSKGNMKNLKGDLSRMTTDVKVLEEFSNNLTDHYVFLSKAFSSVTEMNKLFTIISALEAKLASLEAKVRVFESDIRDSNQRQIEEVKEALVTINQVHTEAHEKTRAIIANKTKKIKRKYDPRNLFSLRWVVVLLILITVGTAIAFIFKLKRAEKKHLF